VNHYLWSLALILIVCGTAAALILVIVKCWPRPPFPEYDNVRLTEAELEALAEMETRRRRTAAPPEYERGRKT
jgi:hypothetical protein